MSPTFGSGGSGLAAFAPKRRLNAGCGAGLVFGVSEQTSLRVLVVGSGAREHALVRAALASARCSFVAAAPGNAGIASECTCLPIGADSIDALVAAAVEHRINLVLIGPEVPLCLGLADQLRKAGIAVFGPDAATARLEGSKIFCKEFLVRHRIPTGTARVFDDAVAARNYIESGSLPVVIKADGLAAGKGVVVAGTTEEALDAVDSMLVRRIFGEAGDRILVEECLAGREASIHVLVADGCYGIMPTSQDHKRALDGDAGPNTGGMGAYSPASWIDDALLARIETEIVRPTLEGFSKDGLAFRGVLFIGVMVTESGPKVLEFNVRFGDPETEVILPRLHGDVLDLLDSVAHGRLPADGIRVRNEKALCVVVASGGYPGNFEKGIPIRLPETVAEGVTIYHAGTAMRSGQLVSNGGRVLTITSLAPDLAAAAKAAYLVCDAIEFKGKHYRRDIAWQELGR